MIGVDKTDVLVHVALPEESKAFWSNEFPNLISQPPLETFPYHTFNFFDPKTNVARSGIVLTVGEVGDRTRDAIILFCTKFKPDFVINIGISGRVGGDAQVGDVVIPDQINIYDFRSSIRDTNENSYEIIPGGQSVKIDRLCFNILSSIEFSLKNTLKSFANYCNNNSIIVSSNENIVCERWISERKLAEKPRIVSGPFAVGSMVNKSANFSRDVVQKTNRNIVAVDMESGLVGDALSSLSDPPRFYSVRAISDPGTGEKSSFDAIGQGAIRQWAMANVLTVLRGVLSTEFLFVTELGSDLATSITAERFGNHYLSDYPGQRYVNEADLDGYDSRFANLFRLQQDKFAEKYLFRDFIQYLRDNPRGKRVLVDGHGGAGKSAVLKIASIEVRRQSRQITTLFLNMRLLRSQVSTRELRLTLQSEIDRLAPVLMRSSERTIVFLDELYGFSEEKNIINELETILTRNRPTIVMAFGKDHYEMIRYSSNQIRQSYIENIEFDLEVTLRNISTAYTETLEAVVDGMLKTSGLENHDVTPKKIVEKLKELGFSYANHFVISLYIANWRKPAFRSATNSTTFILLAMRYLCDSMTSHEPRITLEDISAEALRAFSRPLSQREISEKRAPFRDLYRDVFAHFPKIVQTALVANAIVHLLTDAYSDQINIFGIYEIEENSFFSLVFGNDVNSCVKNLLIDPDVEAQVLGTAERLLHEVDPYSLSYALYLFGRARSPLGRKKATAAFETARSVLDRDARHVSNVQQLSEEERYFRLAERSLSISLALNNDDAATDNYIRKLFEDSVEDSLNRSFHLEYYGDQSSFGISVDLSLEDRGGPWKRTKEFLGGKIRRMLASGSSVGYDRICVATYFSLVRYRLETNNLDETERDEHRLLAQSLVDTRFDAGVALNGFLALMIALLEYRRFDKIDAILSLYELKHISRGGWVDRGIIKSDSQGETVAAHTWGAMLLADALSDWIRPSLSETDKSNIIRILLSHDIAESIIGDYTPANADAKLKEPDAMAQIAAFATFDGLSSISRWQHDWENFENRRGIVAGLAKDFDKLDAVFQGLRLASNFPSIKNRQIFFDWNIQQIVNAQLRNLGQEVRRRAEQVEIKHQKSNGDSL